MLSHIVYRQLKVAATGLALVFLVSCGSGTSVPAISQNPSVVESENHNAGEPAPGQNADVVDDANQDTGEPAQEQNPVVVENANQGTDSWKINQPANDTEQQIKGYASATSVNKGESIDFHISVNTAQTFSIDIYRMGWYNGAGGRLMNRIGPLNGTTQAQPLYDSATGMVSYDWLVSHTLNVPSSWTSGIYLAKLTNSEGFENFISFVVRDDARTANLVYQQPVTTYQAYNSFPRIDAANTAAAASDDVGKSLYEYNSSPALTDAGTTRALQVSFNRPYEGWGDGQFFNWEFYLVSWLERNGYDVAYITNIDLHTQDVSLQSRYKALISAGHDEYWSKAMYDAAEQARNDGVDIAFTGSNAVYWQSRLTPDARGNSDRTLVCYKSSSLDPENEAALKTTRWRDVGRAEQSLIGVQYITDNDFSFNTDYIVTNSDHWSYAGTDFSDGDSVSGIIGYEVDTLHSEVATPVSSKQTILSASPFTGRDGVNVTANSSIYQAPSGAWVYAAGTMSLPWALARDEYIDTRMQRMFANILQRFVNGDPQVLTLVNANFDTDSDGFVYTDNAFRNTSNDFHANGYHTATRGFSGGAIAVRLGGEGNTEGVNMSGGWKTEFDLPDAGNVSLSFRYVLSQTPDYENDEYSDMLLDVNGRLIGTASTDYIARVFGDGDGGPWPSTNWQTVSFDLGTLTAGTHKITIGGFGNQRSDENEITEILIDDVLAVTTD